MHPEALRGWGKRAETDEGIVAGTTSTDAARIAELDTVRYLAWRLQDGNGS
ncbi:hypothetical protein [Streptomyces canus]|uniref:hypothetical protein n=1 Tax=Streptomyces canus TaxID=58343 RepID=UPI0036EFE282